MYFNTHTHLNSEELYPNRDIFIQHALASQVEYIVVAGYDLSSSKRAVEIAHEYPFVYATVGISPNDCKDTTDDDLNEIETLLQDPCVVALGEIGLDYYWEDVPHDKQKDIFQKQIDIARKHDKPIVIHARDAYEDTYSILKQAAHRGIMHCYSGSVEMAKRYIQIGFEISLAGPVTFKNAKVPKKVATEIGIDHLMIETDCPYLAPHPFRGKLNEPANVVYIAQEIAKLKNMEIEDVARITTFNAKRMFGIK
ncbi:TatD family hydrolase [Candidatus Stoquefichus massiliensis]|uniref:TatD family hydrolase n=1 Tax=Candidatus Stoquefichus massiliensis TaxID=1470350 RepID=UPI00048790B5|nr:TatD family hydrolase [Candidatus Stoquefichus massiliensis]